MLEIGDRVRLIKNFPGNIQDLYAGDEGTIVDLRNDWGFPWASIRFDRYVDGHDCGGKCEDGYGWNIDVNDVEKIEYDEPEICTEEELMSFISGGTYERAEQEV